MKSVLPEPPAALAFDDVSLFYVGVMPGYRLRGLAPYYHHRIVVNSADVGHINFRVGDSAHVRLCVGHVGYEVKPYYRGHRYAGKACRALAPLLRRHYAEIILTTDPDNLPSIRTIERLGLQFLDEVTVPPHDPQFARGSRIKRRYVGMPDDHPGCAEPWSGSAISRVDAGSLCLR